MEIVSIIVSSVALLLSIVTATVGVWRWRRRRSSFLVDEIRPILEELDGLVNKKLGFALRDRGALGNKGVALRRKLEKIVSRVLDKRLRKILLDLIRAYDESANAAEESPKLGTADYQKKMETLPFRIAAFRFEVDTPADRAHKLLSMALTRLDRLERRTHGL